MKVEIFTESDRDKLYDRYAGMINTRARRIITLGGLKRGQLRMSSQFAAAVAGIGTYMAQSHAVSLQIAGYTFIAAGLAGAGLLIGMARAIESLPGLHERMDNQRRLIDAVFPDTQWKPALEPTVPCLTREARAYYGVHLPERGTAAPKNDRFSRPPATLTI